MFELEKVEGEHTRLHSFVSTCDTLVQQQQSVLSDIEFYLSGYGYLPWEKQQLVEKEVQQSNCGLSDIDDTGARQSRQVLIHLDSSLHKDHSNTEAESPSVANDSLACPKIEDFGLSRQFMEEYLTRSISKSNKQTPLHGLRHGMSSQRIQNVPTDAIASKVGKHASKQLYKPSALTLSIPNDAAHSHDAASSPPTQDSCSSPLDLPKRPVFMTPGLRPARHLVDHSDDDITGVMPLEAISPEDTAPPIRPQLTLSLDELEVMRQEYAAMKY